MKLSGDARIKYAYTGTGANWYTRGRLAVKHDINDKVSVNARLALMSDNPLGLSEHWNHKINTFSGVSRPNGYVSANRVYPDLNATDGSWVSDANMQFKKLIGADKVTLGRFGQTFGATGLMGDEDAYGGIDGIKFDWSGSIGALTVGYAKFGASQKYPEINSSLVTPKNAVTNHALFQGREGVGNSYQRKPVESALFVNGQLKLGPAVTLHGMWIKEMNNGKSQMIKVHNGTTYCAYVPWFFDNPNDHDIRGIGLTAQITPSLRLVGDYTLNANDFFTTLGNGQKNATNSAKNYTTYRYPRQKAEYISLRYKEAKWGEKGSFGINLDWRHVDPSVRLCGYASPGAVDGLNYDYYVMSDTLFNPLSMADNLLASEGIRGPVIGFNYMVTNNVKLSIMQTFANTYDYYQFSVEKKTPTAYWGYMDRIHKKADNMTIVSVEAKF